MNLEGEKFQELLELYPETAQNLKLRALEKRSIYMYYKNKVSADKKSKHQSHSERFRSARLSARMETKDRQRKDLFTSTYNGEEADSDFDDCHITMPFKHSEELHNKVLFEPEFESDEEYELEAEEQD